MTTEKQTKFSAIVHNESVEKTLMSFEWLHETSLELLKVAEKADLPLNDDVRTAVQRSAAAMERLRQASQHFKFSAQTLADQMEQVKEAFTDFRAAMSKLPKTNS